MPIVGQFWMPIDKRKLTAILSADVKGYSRLMGQDEAETVKTITAYRKIMGELIHQHRRRSSSNATMRYSPFATSLKVSVTFPEGPVLNIWVNELWGVRLPLLPENSLIVKAHVSVRLREILHHS
jgi:class 3 adenylate cyclase